MLGHLPGVQRMAPTASLSRPTLFLAFTLVVVTAGCKPGAQDLCERYAKAQCRFQYGCCNASERQTLNQGFGQVHHDEATCVEETTKAICALLAVYADAEQQARATWNYEQANVCLSEMEAAASACDAEAMLGGGGLDDDCDISELVTGTVEDEGTCYESFECANDEAVCVGEEPEDEEETLVSAKGTCTPPPGIGEECPDFVCTEAGWCDTSEDPPVCKAKLPNGEDCSSPFQCESGVCDFADGTCGPKKPVGSPCFSHVECATEFCDAVAGECSEKQPNGAPCSDNVGCESGYCDFDTGECAPVDGPEVRYDICTATEQ